MAKYKYRLYDYHAIKKAEIKLDGITVLSGINGCGKSTLSRWLYYLVNGSGNYDNFLFNDYRGKIVNLVNRMLFACMDLERFRKKDSQVGKSILPKLQEVITKITQIHESSKEQVELVQELFLQALYIVESFLVEGLGENIPTVRKNRIFNFLNINAGSEDIRQTLESFIEQNRRLIISLTRKLSDSIEKRPAETFFNLIDDNFDIHGDIPTLIQLEEDGVNLIEESHISTLFDLHHAIYIDTPMAIGIGDTENVFWNSLGEIIEDDLPKKNFSFEEKKFLFRVKELLGGETVMDDDELLQTKSLRYVSNDKKVNILLKDAATGFKTFSYLQRLLENGYLNSATLLMIDEPEAHLHPQWIVEFARILVLLNKDLGLKIMIASHNPDMVAAIHDIAQKEDVLENTNFYVAQPESPDCYQYIYKELGHDISEIFESFNIALDNINRYGGLDIQ